MTKPKSVGKFPLTSRHDSPASSVRITSQCFCMNNVLERDGCIAMRWTQWPTSAFGSGMYCECRPRLIGRHVLPPSSVRNAPAAEMAMYIRWGLLGSRRIVFAQPRYLLPRLAAVSCADQRGVLHSGVNGIRVSKRRYEMPDPFDLPR